MTTKVTITNEHNSNGDIHIVKSCGFGAPERTSLFPGDPAYETWMATGHVITIQETWPTQKPKPEPVAAEPETSSVTEAAAEVAEGPSEAPAAEQPAPAGS